MDYFKRCISKTFPEKSFLSGPPPTGSFQGKALQNLKITVPITLEPNDVN